MEGGMLATPTCAPNWRWRLRDLQSHAREWVTQMLLRAVVWLARDSNIISYARRELPDADRDEMQADMNRCILQLLAVFSLQANSGFSASYATSVVEKLMRFEPLSPLTGADDEWIDHGNGVFQNRRCSHVFKQPDLFGGQPYDLDGRVFREPSGACYTNWESMVPITFPYTPKREYVDVPERD